MIQILAQWVIAALILLATAYLLPGFRVGGFGSAMFAAVFIGLANIFIKPVLLFISFPINLLTLGLFTIIVNAAVLKISAALAPGFEIHGWWPAIWGSILMAVLNYLIYGLVSSAAGTPTWV